MTDDPHADNAADDLAVRRLLADARHTEPMPDDVAARMDAVLADLAADEHTEPDPEPDPEPAKGPAPLHPVVVSLDARRRRRAAGMLVAAAAIVVGGVVVAQHLPTSSQSSATTADDSAAGSAVDGTTGDSRSPGSAPPLVEDGQKAELRAGRVVVRPQHFTADALAARRLLRGATAPESEAPGTSQARGGCVTPGVRGRRVPATYQQAPAVLVFQAPASGSQVVDLYVCGSRQPVRSVTLPSP